MKSYDWSRDQMTALDRIEDWRSNGYRNPCCTMGGLAGTGKSTLISYLDEHWHAVAAVALCGKAAHVLRAKGVAQAQTIHSLMYVPFEGRDGKTHYRKRDHLDGIDIIIVDEASMVDEYVYSDLSSYGLPMLLVGDHGQLQPIGKDPGLMLDPQIRLEEIHRQARDNPILRLAMAFREGRPVPYWKDPKGRLQILSRANFENDITPQSQIICGFNRTRHALNAKVRDMLGLRGLVARGDKLICLRNNAKACVFNGQQAIVQHVGALFGGVLELTLQFDDGRAGITLPCLARQFGHNLIEDHTDSSVLLFDYGNAITGHKAQGSEWDDGMVLEEIAGVWDKQRWRYTTVTRFKKRMRYYV
jgi:exodeoxyribonuclease-5